MLKNGRVAARLPAQDLERARAFYAEKLGLEPAEEREGGLRYVCANGEFALFESTGSAAGDHTQMGWEVDDIEATVSELRSRGVVFEEYDLPGLKTIDGIAEIEGQYPSKGSGERGAWFRDSEGNMLGIGDVGIERSRACFSLKREPLPYCSFQTTRKGGSRLWSTDPTLGSPATTRGVNAIARRAARGRQSVASTRGCRTKGPGDKHP